MISFDISRPPAARTGPFRRACPAFRGPNLAMRQCRVFGGFTAFWR
jgi:hypothetical protein